MLQHVVAPHNRVGMLAVHWHVCAGC
jgi:hypothetical protein